MRNEGDATFASVDGPNVADHGVGRGVAAEDINGDGCLDLYLVNQNQPSRALVND